LFVPRFFMEGQEMNKQIVKQTMLSLTARDLESAREKYLEYVESARLDRSEPIENDEQAQAELASDLSEAFDDAVHSHSDKIEKLSTIDFGPKNRVEEGAVVKLGGRFFVIAVSTGKFACDGKDIMGISTQAPIYVELEGKQVGDTISFNGRELVIEEVA
jgi:transcription elongation GreA/GreB family factor